VGDRLLAWKLTENRIKSRLTSSNHLDGRDKEGGDDKDKDDGEDEDDDKKDDDDDDDDDDIP
jgi:hypothetical protein